MKSAGKIRKLFQRLEALPGLSVALSGGLDSSVLLVLAVECLGSSKVEALTVASEIMPEGSLVRARLLASRLGVKHQMVPFDHLNLKFFRENPLERCYHCKRAMFAKLKEIASFPLADGTQEDDLSEDRPGLKALRELGILSPLLEAGFRKKELQEVARKRRLEVYREEASPCLATRFLPGEEITGEKIELVKRAEAYLRASGWRKVRVRLARGAALIEIAPEELEAFFSLRDEASRYFQELGFKKVYLSLRGYEPPLLTLNNDL